MKSIRDKKGTRRKIVSIGYVLKRFIMMGVFFYTALIAWQIFVFRDNLRNDSSDPAGIIFFLLSVMLWFFCYFEIRLLTKNEQRFLGYKAFILYFFKPLCIITSIFTSYLCLKFTESIIVLVLIQSVWFTLYSILLVCFFYPYKKLIKGGSCNLILSYQIRVRKWYKEGEIT